MTIQGKAVIVAGAFIATGAAVVVIVLATATSPTDQTEPLARQADGAASAPAGEFLLNPAPKKQWLYCAAMVNDARFIRLDGGSPLYVQCVFCAPAAEGDVTLPEPGKIAIRVTDAAGATVKVDWAPLGVQPKTAQPGETATVAWQAAGPSLPAGEYQVAVSLPPDYSPGAGLAGPHIEPARFAVLNTPPSDYRNAMFARRVKTLSGKTDEVLADLKRLSAAAPADNSLRLELVDALDAAGQTAQARRQLLEAAHRMTHDASGKRTAPVPPSIALRLEELNAKLAPDAGGTFPGN